MNWNDILKTAIALSFFVSPILAALPIFFAPRSQDPRSGLLWLVICFYAIILSSMNVRIQLVDITFLSFMFRWIVGPVSAVIFVVFLILAAHRLPDLKPCWLCFVAAISLLPLISLGFSGIADLIDGSEGPFGIMQYGFEFYIRALDMLSFGFLSNYDAGGYSEFVTLTQDGSITVLLFNLVVGSVLVSTIFRLVFGRVTHDRH